MRGVGIRGVSSVSPLCILNILKDYFLTHLQLTLKVYTLQRRALTVKLAVQ